jgi:hypothetical protein
VRIESDPRGQEFAKPIRQHAISGVQREFGHIRTGDLVPHHELTPAHLISALADAEQFQKVVKIGSMAATYKNGIRRPTADVW